LTPIINVYQLIIIIVSISLVLSAVMDGFTLREFILLKHKNIATIIINLFKIVQHTLVMYEFKVWFTITEQLTSDGTSSFIVIIEEGLAIVTVEVMVIDFDGSASSSRCDPSSSLPSITIRYN
jgi:hypothetical protein